MLLEQHLSALGIPFWTESDMRAHGYFKTPDIWLQVTFGGGRSRCMGLLQDPGYTATGPGGGRHMGPASGGPSSG